MAPGAGLVGLVCAYLELRFECRKDRIARTMTRFRTPREQLLGVFDAQGESFTEPEFNSCPFGRATSKAADDGAIRKVADRYRTWIRDLFAELAATSGCADPEALALPLALLYDGTAQSAGINRDPSAATTARAAALLDAAPLKAAAPTGQ